MNIIPPLESYGTFEVREPYVVKATSLYRTTAHRTYEEIAVSGVDVYQLAYAGVGLTKEDLQSDRVNQAVIVTLQSIDDGPIYIPSTYILSYPGMDFKPYSHLIGSVSMGPLADDFDVSLVADVISTVVSDTIGVTPTVQWHRVPHTGSVSLTQHEQLEEAREAAIVSRVTDHSELLRLSEKVAEQTTYIERLEELLLQYQQEP